MLREENAQPNISHILYCYEMQQHEIEAEDARKRVSAKNKKLKRTSIHTSLIALKGAFFFCIPATCEYKWHEERLATFFLCVRVGSNMDGS
jgi:hypothetical protein